MAFYVKFSDDVFYFQWQKQEALQSLLQNHTIVWIFVSMLLLLFIFHLPLYLYQITTASLRITNRKINKFTLRSQTFSLPWWVLLMQIQNGFLQAFKLAQSSLSPSVHGATLSQIRPIFLVMFCASPQLATLMNSKIIYKKNQKYVRGFVLSNLLFEMP